MSEQQWTYTTKRMMLLEERSALSNVLSEAYKALSGLVSGEISSYNLGSWSVSRSRPDLDKLKKWIDETRLRIDEIDCILSGRPVRHTSTCVYTNPQPLDLWRLP